MKTVNSIEALRACIADWRRAGFSIGFAPTMGNLHQGHLELVAAALAQCDRVVSSIFVNPLQFGPNEDFDSYPRTLADDQGKLAAAGCHLLFAPPVEEMYPQGQAAVTTVAVPELTSAHCGAARPGHFDGVTTVVAKLLNLVQPDSAFFGKKDYQQWRVISRMVDDLCWPVNVVGIDTHREADGLAMSSRNQYLSADERAVAPLLREVLLLAKQQLEAGTTVEAVAEQATSRLQQAGFVPDYFNVSDCNTLELLTGVMDSTSQAVILAAARLGAARLIDNIEV